MGRYLLFDVGGTNIKINGYDDQKGFKSLPIVYPAKAQADQNTILKNFSSLLKLGIESFVDQDDALVGVGLAFPGPFDYEHGISQINGLNKYEAIYGFELGKYLATALSTLGYPNTPLLFLNDAQAFGLGSQHQSLSDSGLYITLGTGCGSCFVESGELVRPNLPGINAAGMIYDAPYQTSVIDDYLSARGLVKLMQAADSSATTGLELFMQARDGSYEAKQVFRQFGEQIESALLPFVIGFKPEELVFGGEISGSLRFIETGFSQLPTITQIKTTKNTSLSTMLGLVAKLRKDK